MLVLSSVIGIIVCTFFFGRFFAAKTRLVEEAIDKAIAQRLAASPVMLEMQRLKEANGVMQNLLIDLVENEASAAQLGEQRSEAARRRLLVAQAHRRREIFAEAVFVLQQAGAMPPTERQKI